MTEAPESLLYSEEARQISNNYLWKIIEKCVPNVSSLIICTYSEHRDRSCADEAHSPITALDGELLECSINCLNIYIYISLVISPFSDRVGLPLHNIPSS